MGNGPQDASFNFEMFYIAGVGFQIALLWSLITYMFSSMKSTVYG